MRLSSIPKKVITPHSIRPPTVYPSKKDLQHKAMIRYKIAREALNIGPLSKESSKALSKRMIQQLS